MMQFNLLFVIQGNGCVLVQSKEVEMIPADAQRILQTDNYSKIVQQGKCIRQRH